MPRMRTGTHRFEKSVWEDFKRKLVTDTALTLEEANRRKAVAEMLLAEFAVDRQINERSPEAAWHRTHGWLHPLRHLEEAAAAVAAGETTREAVAEEMGVDLEQVDAENAHDQERLRVNGWTVLPEGFEVTFEQADDTWLYADTEADDPIMAGIDTQMASEGYVHIDIAVSGKPRSKIKIRRDVSESFLRDIETCFMGY
ncbi:hypothetical protein ABIA25_002903 [Sinorhizobium fredii]|uniref:hypothetical protein n=1 Tax=Rhizobium fredii TaxID=380 RepID=UPI003517ACE4